MTQIGWPALLVASAVLAATPGANQILALRNGVRSGAMAAIRALAGRFAAFALLVLAVAAGLGALLAASSVALQVVKWCGVAYLVWLGLRLIFGARHDAPHEQPPASSRGGLARQEFGVALTNPKALLLFAVFLPQFLPAGGTDTPGTLLLIGAVYIGVEFCFACGYAALGAVLGRFGRTATARRWTDRVTGVTMLGMAAWLAGQRTAAA